MPGALPDGEPVPADGALPESATRGLGERPFGLYVHVPFCTTRCGYCDFNTYTAAELAHLVTDSGAVIAFADGGPARLLAALPDPPLTRDPRAVPGGPGHPGIVPGPDDTALLAYTSGTTGRPKGVPLTHRQLAVSIRAAMAAWRWQADDVLVHALPLYHQHGLGGLHAALIAGGTVHVRSKFSADDLVRAAAGTRASVLFAVPTIYQALADAPIARAGGSRRHQAWPTPPWLSTSAVLSMIGTAARNGQENVTRATPNISVTTGDITSPTRMVSTAQDTNEFRKRGLGRPAAQGSSS